MKRKPYRTIAIIIAIVLIASVVVIARQLPRFQISNLDITPVQAMIGDEVKISANIENTGTNPATYQATLKVNKEIAEQKNIELPAKSQKPITFIYVPQNPGTYFINLGNLEKQLTVVEGLLPIWYAGDTWTYRVTAPELSSEITYEVINQAKLEDTDIYLLRSSGVSAATPFTRNVSMIDKKTLLVLEEEQSGKINEIPIHRTIKFNSKITDGTNWPLSPGKSWVIQYDTEINAKNGLVVNTEQKNMSHSFSVEKTEDITTPAGSFKCLKILEKDENNNIAGTFWYSDKIKREARYQLVIQGKTYTYDLTSYKIANEPPTSPSPSITINRSKYYENLSVGLNFYYPQNWQITLNEEEGTANLSTVNVAENRVFFSSVRIRTVVTSENATLDIVHESILKDTKETDTNFILLESKRVSADLPWYEITWNSAIDSIKTKGKTIIALKGQRLYIVTGWVQQQYENTYWPQLEQVINSFGIFK